MIRQHFSLILVGCSLVAGAPSAMAATGRELAAAERYYADAERFRSAGDPGRSLDAFSKAIALNPAHYDARLGRSQLYTDLKRYDLAAVDLTPLVRTGIIAVGLETPQQEAALRGIPQASIILAASYLSTHGERLCRLLLYQRLDDSAAAIGGRLRELFPESHYLAVVPGHLALLAGDTLSAWAAYRAALGLLTSMDELVAGPLRDIEVFAENGWQPDASRRAGEWLREQFAADGRHYVAAVRLVSRAAELAEQKRFAEAPQLIDKAVAAERSASHPRPGFLAQILGMAGDLCGQAGQFSAAARYYESAVAQARLSGAEQSVSIQLDKLATVNKMMGAYDQALDRYRQALAIDSSLGDRENVAAGLRKIGKVYYAWGKYAEALDHHRRALGIDRELGRDEAVCDDLNEIGVAYHAQARYGLAIEHYTQVMAIARRLGADEMVAVCHNNIGMVYNDWGKYDQALENYHQAQDLYRRMERDDNLAVTLNNIGLVYDAWGKYDQALRYYEQALAIDRAQERGPDVAVRLNNIGGVYSAWGKYDQAIGYYRQALAIDSALGKEGQIPTYLSNIGRVYRAWGKHDQAIGHYRQALALDSALGQEGNIGKDLVNIGSVLYDQGLYDRAIEHFQTARAADQALGRESNVAQELVYTGKVYQAWGKLRQARDQLRQALAIQKKLGETPAVAATLADLGRTAFAAGEFAEAEKRFRESIALIEQIRLTAAGDIRRDYLASQLAAYQWLALADHRAGRPAAALDATEQSRAKYLVEQLGERAGGAAAFRGAKDWQQRLGDSTAVVCFANIDLDLPLAQVLTSTGLRSVQLDKAAFDRAVTERCRDAIATALDTLEAVAPAAAAPGQRSDELIRQDRERADFERIVNFYRYLLTKPRLKGRALEQFRYVSRMLHRFLLEPLAAELSGKSELIILPDGVLGFIPFETLLDADSLYLAQRCAVRYTQSLSVLQNIAGRRYPDGRQPLLALGGAVYRQDTYAADMAGAGVAYREPPQPGPPPQRDADGSPSAPWHNLPGTLIEVRRIRDVVDGATVLTGDEVEESRIKRLSSEGELRTYRVVHLATHGQVDLARPELSAVVLSQYDPPRGGEDGYLRVPEVAGLDLNADLVVLSACETGLGKIYGGEGVVGLTQAFLLAGTNGLSVSLWQVADESTMRFMVEMYRLVREDGLRYPAAFAAVRRRFISGEIGGASYQNPYFWAPFVYYGQ